jgi:hypothetical protein
MRIITGCVAGDADNTGLFVDVSKAGLLHDIWIAMIVKAINDTNIELLAIRTWVSFMRHGYALPQIDPGPGLFIP